MVLASLSIAEELFALQRSQQSTEPTTLTSVQVSEISERIEQLLSDIKS
jgi:hypothetical protein